MKILILFALILPFTTFADSGQTNSFPGDDLDCIDSFSSLNDLTSLSIKNCFNSEKLKEEIKAQSKIKKGKVGIERPLCDECRTEFLKRFPASDKIKSANKTAYIETVTREIEKSISSTLGEIVSLRNLYSVGKFEKAIISCSTEKFKNKLALCGVNIDLSSKVADELASLIRKKNDKKNSGLLNRGKDDYVCPISDQEILTLKPLVLEKMITPEMVMALSELKSRDELELENEIRERFENSKYGDFTLLIRDHPILSSLKSDPLKFVSFFKSLKNVKEADLASTLKTKLYTKEFGDVIDSRIADKCEKSFSPLVESVCARDFKSEHIDLGSIENAKKFMNDNSDYDDMDAAPTEKIVNYNLGLLSFCDNAHENVKYSLDKTLKKINSALPSDYAGQSQSLYSVKKYQDDFNASRSSLCNFVKSPPKDCSNENDTISCRLYFEYKNLQDPLSSESKLASAPDQHSNELLRSLIGGSSTNISTETRKTLVSEGILPSADGKFASVPTIAERAPDFIPTASPSSFERSQNGSSSPVAPSNSNTARAQNISSPKSNSQTTAAPYVPSSTTTESATQGPGVSRTARAEDLDSNEEQELNDIQNEIKRKLAGGNRRTANQVPQNEVRNTVREVSGPTNRKPAARNENAIVDDFYRDSQQVAEGVVGPGVQNGDKAKMTSGGTLNEQKKERQQLEAISGMEGAKKIAERENAERIKDSMTKTLRTVSLDIDETKVKLDLAEILSDKVNANDPAGIRLKSLLEGKEDFILEVNKTSFKVVFDEKVSAFKIAYESGDKLQASSMIPYLDKFLNKLF